MSHGCWAREKERENRERERKTEREGEHRHILIQANVVAMVTAPISGPPPSILHVVAKATAVQKRQECMCVCVSVLRPL